MFGKKFGQNCVARWGFPETATDNENPLYYPLDKDLFSGLDL